MNLKELKATNTVKCVYLFHLYNCKDVILIYVAGYLAKIALSCTSLDLRNSSEAKMLIFLTRKSLSSTQNNENAFVMAFRAQMYSALTHFLLHITRMIAVL